MCCTRLADNTGRKNVAKNRHLGTISLVLYAFIGQYIIHQGYTYTTGSIEHLTQLSTPFVLFYLYIYDRIEYCHAQYFTKINIICVIIFVY